MTLYRVWVDEWNDIIRNVIYPDEKLKQLMCIPEGTSIVNFIDKYFIRAGYTGALLKDQKVRIVYGDVGGVSTDVPDILKHEISFDIYVKLDSLHNAQPDRLIFRTNLIADRINELLTKDRYLNGYRFWISTQSDLGTQTIGYARHNISFHYMKVY